MIDSCCTDYTQIFFGPVEAGISKRLYEIHLPTILKSICKYIFDNFAKICVEYETNNVEAHDYTKSVLWNDSKQW